MQTHSGSRTVSRDGKHRTAPIISSFTCPQCRTWDYGEECRRCGWTPETTVTELDCDEELEDSIFAC